MQKRFTRLISLNLKAGFLLFPPGLYIRSPPPPSLGGKEVKELRRGKGNGKAGKGRKWESREGKRKVIMQR